MKTVNSFADFISGSAGIKNHFLLLYKGGNPVSECAFNAIKEAIEADKADAKIFVADVSIVRDIHSHFAINSVPSLLVFDDAKHVNTIKGCHTAWNYRNMIERVYTQSTSADKPSKNVTVYSTPTCSWCNTLKTWLQKNKVAYTDIDVSRDQHAAQELVRRSGQQGVPQTEINGKIVVGFDQQKLKELLEIQ